MRSAVDGSRPLWTPSSDRVAAANLTAFRRATEAHTGRWLPDYPALHAWSVEHSAAFWGFYAEYSRLPLKTEPTRILGDEPMPQTRWFAGATLNYAEALLYPPGVRGDEPALFGVTEAGAERSLSFAELRREVARAQAALRRDGVGRGDRVAAFATNTAETLILLLACASLGVLFSSCSPDFGAAAAGARFGQIGPKLLFVSEHYRYGGKVFDTRGVVAALAEELKPGRVVALPYPGEVWESSPGTVPWSEWVEPADGEPDFEPLPFDHPLYILYSSGTTGLPKAMVHRAGGALLTHHKEQHLHSDIRAGDVVLYFSTCGWMMWNWLVSCLAQGAAIVLYEGSPVQPDLGVLWRLAERFGITYFGTGARFLHCLVAQDIVPRDTVDLSALRTIASTGSPLSPTGFRYVYERVKGDVHLASISGGTDIVGCFMAGVPTQPVYAGQIQGPALGVDLAAFGSRGEPVFGEPGELVCRRPLPSMPLAFWNDPTGERYREAYFAVYEGVWRHGDLIEITPQGGIVVYGRSDATLNPGGVRIGTAEIYRPLEGLPEVVEAAAIGNRRGDDEEIWLFVVLAEGSVLDASLEERIRGAIRTGASPRHVPRRVLQVDELPRTRSDKVMEIAISQVVNGQDVPNRSVMANPEALEAIVRLVRDGS